MRAECHQFSRLKGKPAESRSPWVDSSVPGCADHEESTFLTFLPAVVLLLGDGGDFSVVYYSRVISKLKTFLQQHSQGPEGKRPFWLSGRLAGALLQKECRPLT
eukprot:TRINITY_DN12987_c0_g1_i2.p1 TRINITY_DN12987_c0_g1~~TRINITY_DN12987_c0_g1_i2.p1  ORF type:complete len:104 (+),score=16.72 TRINITY_DN12987_c0_g1_i2:104-415(+)